MHPSSGGPSTPSAASPMLAYSYSDTLKESTRTECKDLENVALIQRSIGTQLLSLPKKRGRGAGASCATMCAEGRTRQQLRAGGAALWGHLHPMALVCWAAPQAHLLQANPRCSEPRWIHSSDLQGSMVPSESHTLFFIQVQKLNPHGLPKSASAWLAASLTTGRWLFLTAPALLFSLLLLPWGWRGSVCSL